jgi:hypothetical protein
MKLDLLTNATVVRLKGISQNISVRMSIGW